MDATQGANPPSTTDQTQQLRQPAQKNASVPKHPSLLSYWAFAIPSDARLTRVAAFQPFGGIVFIIVGIVVSIKGWVSQAVIAGVGGAILAVVGAILLGTSYWISVLYFEEYPGGFGAYLEEYVARRVSRLVKDEFIPQYRAQTPADARTIKVMNGQVSLALQGELLRLEQLEKNDPSGMRPVCGVLVVGPAHSNKTGALWEAMKQHLSEWTFVRWPHHMDHPANLAGHLGHRIVLWLDDLHDYANLGEAAALDQFIQQLRRERRQFLVLSSCRSNKDSAGGDPKDKELDKPDLRLARRYFRPLINDLRQVDVSATASLRMTAQIEDFDTAFEALRDSPRSVLETIDWLESLRVHTFAWEVLGSLSDQFLRPEAVRDGDEETLQALANDPTRFVRVRQRANPQTDLAKERYDLGRWFRYTFYPRKFARSSKSTQSSDVHNVLEPINVNYLNLEGSRAERTEQTTDMLEQHPESLVQRLSGSPFAAETLILLGDAYLNHLGEEVNNAGKLAILCYEGALAALNHGDISLHFPGAWAAAHIGKGIAELRAHNLIEAAADFALVTARANLGPDTRPTPRLLIAHAWHGRGDAIAANIPSEMATLTSSQSSGAGIADTLEDAATYFANAASNFPSGDPLQNEARLDRANVLYVIARTATKRFRELLSQTAFADTPSLPPIGAINDARTACLEVQGSYGKETAPAVWAELRRRLGDLCLIQLEWLVPDSMRPHTKYSDATMSMLASQVNELIALDTAKDARDYFAAACDIFAPSYMLMNWLHVQVGLIRADLIIARLSASKDFDMAMKLYRFCITTIDDAINQIAKLGYSPLDWVDLRLLQAQSEIGIGLLSKSDADTEFPKARGTLEDVKTFLDRFLPLRTGIASSRTAAQLAMVDALSAEIERAKWGS